jgi:hypothetical protein
MKKLFVLLILSISIFSCELQDTEDVTLIPLADSVELGYWESLIVGDWELAQLTILDFTDASNAYFSPEGADALCTDSLAQVMLQKYHFLPHDMRLDYDRKFYQNDVCNDTTYVDIAGWFYYQENGEHFVVVNQKHYYAWVIADNALGLVDKINYSNWKGGLTTMIRQSSFIRPE